MAKGFPGSDQALRSVPLNSVLERGSLLRQRKRTCQMDISLQWYVASTRSKVRNHLSHRRSKESCHQEASREEHLK